MRAVGEKEDRGRDVRETLKPNLSGYSLKRRVRREDFPTPDGPEMTRGRRKSARGDMVEQI